MYFYSNSTGGFYKEGIHAEIPSDAVAVSAQLHEQLMKAQEQGCQIGAGEDGMPCAVQLFPAVLDVEKLKAKVTQKRWQVETGGLTLPTGVHVATGIDDQNRITSVIANARLAGLETVSFKAASGWVTLTLSELEDVAAAIAMHVQQCFSAERAHHEAIDALQQLHAEDAQALQQALEAYDVEQGWPATDLQTPQPA